MTIVPAVKLTPHGPSLSAIAFGMWRLADGPKETQTPSAVLARIHKCLNLGITTFDAADIYGGGEGHVCEKLFGDALALEPSLRSKMQIVSKTDIACLGVKVKHYNLSVDYIVSQVKGSLAALKTDFLDVLLIHRPSPMMDADEVAKAFIQLRDSGLVRHFGVSNFTSSQFDLLASRLPFPLVTNQIELHPLGLEPLHDGTLDHLQQHRVTPMAWSPLGGGRLVNPAAAQSDVAVARVQTKLAELAKDICYAWILNQPTHPVVVIGTNSIDRIETAAKACEIKLSLEQWFSIWEASAGREVP
ncbi:hypothetical protein HDU76_010589 [Blyttiomyces sp. JEL0837]|nr:hypothetical protein HDU76_010589 [Blyttiomyces sp. JEL0837]